jgi:hypothetical protein
VESLLFPQERYSASVSPRLVVSGGERYSFSIKDLTVLPLERDSARFGDFLMPLFHGEEVLFVVSFRKVAITSDSFFTRKQY